MNLEKVDLLGVQTVVGLLQQQQPSLLSHHNKDCCDVAKWWFLAMDKSFLHPSSVISMPIWIRESYKWGPCKWPLFWCEVFQLEHLDCGAFAALYHESLKARGIKSLLAQLVLLFEPQNCEHWIKMWKREDVPVNWIHSPFAYHEVCAIQIDQRSEILIWNPEDNCWIDPNQGIGYKRPVAIRVFSSGNQKHIWGELEIESGKWVLLPSHSTSFSNEL